MLKYINQFRTDGDNWYWNESNTAKVKVGSVGHVKYKGVDYWVQEFGGEVLDKDADEAICEEVPVTITVRDDFVDVRQYQQDVKTITVKKGTTTIRTKVFGKTYKAKVVVK